MNDEGFSNPCRLTTACTGRVRSEAPEVKREQSIADTGR